MRRFFLVSIAAFFGMALLLYGYLALDFDTDTVTPVVDVPSYQSIFEESVRATTSKLWSELDDSGRQRAATTILLRQNGSPAREVVLHRLRDIQNTAAALDIIKKSLDALSDKEFEAAIGTVAAMESPQSRAFLDSLAKQLDANPAAHTPLGDYRDGTFIVRTNGEGLEFDFQERSRIDADYTTGRAREISLFLPATPDYVVVLPNIDDQIEEFGETRFVHALDGSPVPDDIWRLPILKTLRSLRGRLDETMGMFAPLFAPERFFSDWFVAARYGENYLIVSYKDKNIEAADAVMDVFEGLGADFGVTRWDVEQNGVAQVRNRRSGRSLSYAIVGDYFVTATDSSLITQSLTTYLSDRRTSAAIDPLLATTLEAFGGEESQDVAYAWINPTTWFNITGSEVRAGRRLAVVERALGRTAIANDPDGRAAHIAAILPTPLARMIISGENPNAFWRYVVDVRSLGRNRIDSLARLAGMDIGTAIIPWLSPAFVVGYGGVEYLKQGYSFSNTAYDMVIAMPLRPGSPARFDSTFDVLLSRLTSVVYTPETEAGVQGRLWMARDTSTNDTTVAENRFLPSFAVINNTLLIGSTPTLLRRAARAVARGAADSDELPEGYISGTINVDSVAANAHAYATSYLPRTDRYRPDEIRERLDPLKNALSIYDRIDWSVTVSNNLRHGHGVLMVKE